MIFGPVPSTSDSDLFSGSFGGNVEDTSLVRRNSQLPLCGNCGQGTFNLCDQEECTSLNSKTTDGLYLDCVFKDGFLENSCTYKPNIAISGSYLFQNKIREALDFLAICSPNDLVWIDRYLSSINRISVQDPVNGSDLYGYTYPTSRVAFIKDLPTKDSVVSNLPYFHYAGVIAHEAQHNRQFYSGFTKYGTQEEKNLVEGDAYKVQVNVLRKCLNNVPKDSQGYAEEIISGVRFRAESLYNVTIS